MLFLWGRSMKPGVCGNRSCSTHYRRVNGGEKQKLEGKTLGVQKSIEKLLRKTDKDKR